MRRVQRILAGAVVLATLVAGGAGTALAGQSTGYWAPPEELNEEFPGHSVLAPWDWQAHQGHGLLEGPSTRTTVFAGTVVQQPGEFASQGSLITRFGVQISSQVVAPPAIDDAPGASWQARMGLHQGRRRFIPMPSFALFAGVGLALVENEPARPGTFRELRAGLRGWLIAPDMLPVAYTLRYRYHGPGSRREIGIYPGGIGEADHEAGFGVHAVLPFFRIGATAGVLPRLPFKESKFTVAGAAGVGFPILFEDGLFALAGHWGDRQPALVADASLAWEYWLSTRDGAVDRLAYILGVSWRIASTFHFRFAYEHRFAGTSGVRAAFHLEIRLELL